MSQHKKAYRRALLPLLCAFTLSACAEYRPKPNPDPQEGDYLPFSIRFDRTGTPIVLDAQGKRVPPRDVNFPIPATAIEKVEALTYVQYRGSHVALIRVGGQMFIIPLAH
ncbi:MAG: hypothetical protein GYB33_05110 [Gammaproteobacteria bacterium]|nr:hypothetical protein [Gammaproteobacteria bacterium]